MKDPRIRWRVALAGLSLLAFLSFYTTGEILLLHGWMGSGTSWTVSKHLLREEPYLVDPEEVLTPSLPNRASLVTWAGNIASYLDGLPAEARITVVAHSFAGPASLLLVVASRHMEEGDFEVWAGSLVDKDSALHEISYALLALDDRKVWVRAAGRISKLFLYQPALGGGCLACSACGKAPLPPSMPEPVGEIVSSVVYDDAVRDMCLLTTTKSILFDRGEIASLEVPVVNIYAVHEGCPGPCLGASFPSTDGYVPLTEQRLFLSGPNYREVYGGNHCHLDLILNLGGAAEALFRIVYPSGRVPEACR